MDLKESLQVDPQNIGFVDAVKRALAQYAQFDGRATKSEYWWFFLLSLLVDIGYNIPYLSWIFGIISLLLLIPFLAVSWRRMHDIGKSGAWWFINLIPVVGNIIWIVWCCKPGEPYTNSYGPVPGPEI